MCISVSGAFVSVFQNWALDAIDELCKKMRLICILGLCLGMVTVLYMLLFLMVPVIPPSSPSAVSITPPMAILGMCSASYDEPFSPYANNTSTFVCPHAFSPPFAETPLSSQEEPYSHSPQFWESNWPIESALVMSPEHVSPTSPDSSTLILETGTATEAPKMVRWLWAEVADVTPQYERMAVIWGSIFFLFWARECLTGPM